MSLDYYSREVCREKKSMANIFSYNFKNWSENLKNEQSISFTDMHHLKIILWAFEFRLD